MLVVEKARHIRAEIKGPGAAMVVSILKRSLPSIEISADDEYENIRDSSWFKTLSAELSPGTALRAYRDNAGMTQAKLSERTGIPTPHISAMEHDRRAIGKVNAKKLAAVLKCDYRRFL